MIHIFEKIILQYSGLYSFLECPFFL